ncbi:hypothetical protein [Iodobacter ciconiae]|nr:hypothetical protein [Iodobacter ciconiae]
MSNISCSVGNDADKHFSPEEEIGQLLCGLSEVNLGLNTTHAKIVLSSEVIMHKLTNTLAELKRMLSKSRTYVLATTPSRAKTISARKITRSVRKFTSSSSAKAASGGDSDSDGEPYSHNQAYYAASSVFPLQQISYFPSQHLQAETSNINIFTLIFQCISVLRFFILLCVADFHVWKLKIASISSKPRTLRRSVWGCVLNLEVFALEGARNV